VAKNRGIAGGSTRPGSTRRGNTPHIQKVRVLGGVLVQALHFWDLPLKSTPLGSTPPASTPPNFVGSTSPKVDPKNEGKYSSGSTRQGSTLRGPTLNASASLFFRPGRSSIRDFKVLRIEHEHVLGSLTARASLLPMKSNAVFSYY